MKIIYSLLFIFFGVISIAQTQSYTLLQDTDSNWIQNPADRKWMYNITKIQNIPAILDSIENALKYGKTVDEEFIASLYDEHATFYSFFYHDKYRKYNYLKNDTSGISFINVILNDYQKAIDTTKLYKSYYKKNRYEFLRKVNPFNPLYKTDLADIKQHGYKNERTGIGFGVNYSIGKNNWFGVEISAKSVTSPRYKLIYIDTKNGDRKVIDKNSMPISIDAGIIGFNKSLGNRNYEFTISPMQLKAPLLINIAKFGLVVSPANQSSYGFWRPEIGIGNSFISVAYAYNLVFQKSIRSIFETHMLTIKVSYPAIKYNKT